MRQGCSRAYPHSSTYYTIYIFTVYYILYIKYYTLYSTLYNTSYILHIYNTHSGTIKFSPSTPAAVKEFVTALMRPKPESRLGYGNMRQVKENPVFQGMYSAV